MARRALLERSEEFADDDLAPAALPPSAGNHPAAPHWHGSGGRWFVWLGRAVLWVVILLVGYRGVMAIADGTRQSAGPSAPARASTATAAATQFPVSTAEAYAVEFGDVYLTFSPGSAGARSKALASFLPPGGDPQLGWNGAGSQRVASDQVASVSVTSAHTAIVTLLARLTSGRLVELGVPIYAAGGAMSVSGNPALLPAPATATPPSASQPSADQSAAAGLQSQLPAFFQAYAGSDRATLARFAAPGAHLAGLNGAVTFGGITSLYVPSGGARRQISVTVTWQLASRSAARPRRTRSSSATLPMTYQMTIVRQGSSWDVQSIGAATQGPP